MVRIGTDMATKKDRASGESRSRYFFLNNGHPRKSHALRTIASQICEFDEILR